MNARSNIIPSASQSSIKDMLCPEILFNSFRVPSILILRRPNRCQLGLARFQPPDRRDSADLISDHTPIVAYPVGFLSQILAITLVFRCHRIYIVFNKVSDCIAFRQGGRLNRVLYLCLLTDSENLKGFPTQQTFWLKLKRIEKIWHRFQSSGLWFVCAVQTEQTPNHFKSTIRIKSAANRLQTGCQSVRNTYTAAVSHIGFVYELRSFRG